MADSSAATGLTVEQWDAKFFEEYLEENRFKSVMGTSENSIIQVKEDLTKKPGDKIHYALVNRLTNAAVEGTATLEGNEEDMISRSHQLTVNKLRNGVRIPEMEEQKSAIGLRMAARSVLKDWIMENMRDRIIAALGSINGVDYASATETQKDAWLVDNADRVLFGALNSNNSSNDHSASVTNIDGTNDKLSAATLTLMKRIALGADPKIKPVRTTEDERWYVVYANRLAFRDLSIDSTITQANREARARNVTTNPIFTGGDLLYDGMVIKNIEDIPILSNVGDGGTTDVGQVYLCGAQAVGLGWAKRTTTKTEEFDYGDKQGVAIEEIRGIDKLTFGSGSGDTDDLKDHGVVTGFFAAVADA